MFIDNKYSRIYYNLIEQASKLERSGYLERHHIIPKSLGGTNKKTNLVSLTFREHFICHRLLPRFTKGDAKRKMLHALWAMNLKNGDHIRPLTSRQYAICKRACSEAASLYRHAPETKKKIADALRKHTRSEEHKTNIGKSSKGRIWSEESRVQKSKKISGNGNPRAARWKIETSDGSVFELDCESLNSWRLTNGIKISSMNKARSENRFHKGFKVTRIPATSTTP